MIFSLYFCSSKRSEYFSHHWVSCMSVLSHSNPAWAFMQYITSVLLCSLHTLLCPKWQEGMRRSRQIDERSALPFSTHTHTHTHAHTLLPLLPAYFHQIITNSSLPGWLNIEKAGREEEEGKRWVWGTEEQSRSREKRGVRVEEEE